VAESTQIDEANKVAAAEDDFKALVRKAEKGDTAALSKLRKHLDGGAAEFLRVNIENEAREAVVGPLCGTNSVTRELVLLELDRVAKDLAGPDPTAIERMLAQRAALCWHLVNHYERHYAQMGSHSLDQGRYHQDRIDRAHRRYLSALKTLATIRKLALPAIQVNIAKKQVNVAGG
jgi:hypothetical protein